MAKSPDQPAPPRPRPQRDPAKHSKKDPAKPTRAKASRPDSAPTDPALEELLNPGIRQGTAGIGSQTGHETTKSGLQPPPDNSWDRREDFSRAHTARQSTRSKEGFNETPQSGYVGKAPVAPGELDPDLAKSLGIEDDAPSGETPGPALLRGKYGENLGVAATAHALESLLREGRREFADTPWVPHRPPRPEKSEGEIGR